MSNNVEKVRLEAGKYFIGKWEYERLNGGWVYFDWDTGHMKAVWDHGYEENWPPRGYSLEANAKSFLMFTDQIDRYLAMCD